MNYQYFTADGIRNAEFILSDIAHGKPGETVAILQDEFTAPAAALMAMCAKRLGMKPFVIDLSVYGTMNFTQVDYTFNPAVKAAMEASDIVFCTGLEFTRLLDSQQAADAIHDGKRRFYYLRTHGIQEWQFDYNSILQARERTSALRELVMRSDSMRIVSPAGTDVTVKLGSRNIAAIYDVLAIIPFFSEVAVVPTVGTVNGVIVGDGAASRLRLNHFGTRELDTEPVRLTVKDGEVIDVQAEKTQLERIKKFMDNATPQARKIDEVGLVTTYCELTDKYQWWLWRDGTHHSKSVHLAIGNNYDSLKDLIHASAHADFDVLNPDIFIDGKMICEKGIYSF